MQAARQGTHLQAVTKTPARWAWQRARQLVSTSLDRTLRRRLGGRVPRALTEAQMRADLMYLRDTWASLDRSFSAQQRRRFESIVCAALEHGASLTTADFSLEISRALAVARNGHTSSSIGPYFHALPVKPWWFSDGLYVLRADPQHTGLLGARIERFGTLTAQQALCAIAPFISGVDQRIRMLSPCYLRLLEVLHRIGAAPSSREVELTVTLPDGDRRVLTLQPGRVVDPDTGPAWLPLIPTESSVRGRWSHVLDSSRERSPGYARPALATSEWLDTERSVLYVRSNRLTVDTHGELQAALLRIIDQRIVQCRPRAVVVDVRLNDGGDLFETALFAQALPKLMPKDGDIFALIGPGTFSAALAFVAMLKGHDRDRVVLVGEPMGDHAAFWADGENVELPHSKLVVQSAAKHHDWANGSGPDQSVACWANVAFGRANVDLTPQILVTQSFADYARGVDTPLLRVVAMCG